MLYVQPPLRSAETSTESMKPSVTTTSSMYSRMRAPSLSILRCSGSRPFSSVPSVNVKLSVGVRKSSVKSYETQRSIDLP